MLEHLDFSSMTFGYLHLAAIYLAIHHISPNEASGKRAKSSVLLLCPAIRTIKRNRVTEAIKCRNKLINLCIGEVLISFDSGASTRVELLYFRVVSYHPVQRDKSGSVE